MAYYTRVLKQHNKKKHLQNIWYKRFHNNAFSKCSYERAYIGKHKETELKVSVKNNNACEMKWDSEKRDTHCIQYFLCYLNILQEYRGIF